MDILRPKSIEGHIINLLQKQSLTSANLLVLIQERRPGTTKQALYAALRKLRAQEIVILHKKVVSLSSIWVTKMNEFFQLAHHFYINAATSDNGFLNLEDGDRISYTFKNPTTTDIFWGHASLLLRSIMPAGEPLYLYMPHDWFLLAREEPEKASLVKCIEEGHPWRLYIASKTPLDEYNKSMIKKPHLVHTEDKKYFKNNYYFNSHGDYIIEVWLDPKTQELIDAFYKTYTVWDKSARTKIMSIISNMKGNNRLTISRNKKRADAFKKTMGKYFPVKPSAL